VSWISWAFGGIGVVVLAAIGRQFSKTFRDRSERRSVIADRNALMELMYILTEAMKGRDYQQASQEWKRKSKVERERVARQLLSRWEDGPDWTPDQFDSIPSGLIKRAAYVSYWEFSDDDDNLTPEMTRANFEDYFEWWMHQDLHVRISGLEYCFRRVI
jgi:hypothetical protein